MNKTFVYCIILLMSTAFSIILMLSFEAKELLVLKKEIENPDRTYFNYYENDTVSVFEKQKPVDSLSYSSLKKTNKAGLWEEKSGESCRVNQDENDRKNITDEKTNEIKKEKLQELIQERKRENSNDGKNGIKEDKSNNDDNALSSFVVTPEKIQKAQKEMGFLEKAKVVNLIVKIGPKGVSEISKISQKGISPEKNIKIMNVLKEHLSDDDINFVMNMANKYLKKDNAVKY
ncbi:hypothetical protein ACETAC_08300 [Aceticella autotrophica]|uniref:Uncharacterized protein n=1 Tax=Aceticella autotrophica TaxID=2755338 RepID=A0A975AUU6_9THEO|nr:hypothetical protein [Aceticella autotrophica]QSZ26870.1 hypothetical protein ACETAC_08300 [Aceticella autotrophica]